MRTIRWKPEGPAVEMIDQRLLPAQAKMLVLDRHEDVADAIADMAIRGAPAIGAAGAFGLALAAQNSTAEDPQQLMHELVEAADRLLQARPTAINLAWAISRLMRKAEAAESHGIRVMRDALLQEAQQLADEDVEINRRIGEHGAALIPEEATLIHHCNTGALATVDYGTALGVIRCAHEKGKRLHILVDETRPRLQGARLTAWELEQYGISYEIITDNAAGHFLACGEVDAVLVGADRVAANGDLANKIGTYMLALAAYDNDVPFYVALPTSTIDLETESGSQIPIEERSHDEVLNLRFNDQAIAPANSRARNPAFDITPHRLVTAFITEIGVLLPPFHETLRTAVEKVGKT